MSEQVLSPPLVGTVLMVCPYGTKRPLFHTADVLVQGILDNFSPVARIGPCVYKGRRVGGISVLILLKSKVWGGNGASFAFFAFFFFSFFLFPPPFCFLLCPFPLCNGLRPSPFRDIVVEEFSAP